VVHRVRFVVATSLRRHAPGCRLGRVYCGPFLLRVARRGRRLEHRQAVRHGDAGPADGRGRVGEPRVRLLAQGGRLATGHVVGTAVARDCRLSTAATAVVVFGGALDAPQAVLRGPTSE